MLVAQQMHHQSVMFVHESAAPIVTGVTPIDTWRNRVLNL